MKHPETLTGRGLHCAQHHGQECLSGSAAHQRGKVEKAGLVPGAPGNEVLKCWKDADALREKPSHETS